MRILLCRDIDSTSSTLMAEKFVPQSPIFDAVILCGPFIHEPCVSDEARSIAEGDIASLIAQFENIVCRVIYLPSSTDPASCLIDQLHLTPNSVALHARQLNLAKDLFIMGFTENDDLNSASPIPKSVDRSDESDEELEGVTVNSGTSSSMIEDMVLSVGSTEACSDRPTGIFALNYRNSHTLNHMLFNMPMALSASCIELCIVSSDSEECSRLPSKLGKLSIAALKSLRIGGYYTIVELQRSDSENGDRWHTTSITTQCLSDETS